MAPVVEFRFSPDGNAPADTDHTKGAVPPAVMTDFEYGAATVPPGNDVVVIDSVPATVIANGCEAVAPALSTTRMVTFVVPTVVGVPEISPVLVLRLSPAGNVPSDTAHVSDPVPPVEATVFEYATPAVAPGKDVVVMESGGAIVIERGFESEALAASTTPMVKFEVPAADGVPEIAPVALLRLSPAGSAPALMDHVSGAVPPAATTIFE
jgi:hypothetical protein